LPAYVNQMKIECQSADIQPARTSLGSGVGVSKPQRLYGDNLVDLPQKKTEPVDFSILAIL